MFFFYCFYPPLFSCFHTPPSSFIDLLHSEVCVTPAGVFTADPLWWGKFAWGLLLRETTAQWCVWRGAVQTALIMWGVHISADDSSFSWAKRLERRKGGGGYYNDFLKSLCRGYKLYSLSHFSQWCVTHLLCFASFHATPGCVWECGVVSGGWWMGLRGEVQRGFQHLVQLSHDSPMDLNPKMT